LANAVSAAANAVSAATTTSSESQRCLADALALR